VNLGNPEEYTVLELAQKTLELTGSSARLVFKPLPQDDPQQRCPDISRAKRLLDWQPTVSLTTGLKEAIRYFKEKLPQLG
jgi:UDP-glucuronate decarboxylase